MRKGGLCPPFFLLDFCHCVECCLYLAKFVGQGGFDERVCRLLFRSFEAVEFHRKGGFYEIARKFNSRCHRSLH